MRATPVDRHDWRVFMEAQDERSVPSSLAPSRGPLTGIRVVELADEQAEYDRYRSVFHFVTILQSKARAYLKRHPVE